MDEEELALYFTRAENEGLATYIDSRNVHRRPGVQQRLQTVATVAEILPQECCCLALCRILVRTLGRETTCI